MKTTQENLDALKRRAQPNKQHHNRVTLQWDVLRDLIADLEYLKAAQHCCDGCGDEMSNLCGECIYAGITLSLKSLRDK